MANLAMAINQWNLFAGGQGSGRHPYATTTSLDILDHHGFKKLGNGKDGRSIYKSSEHGLVAVDSKKGTWEHYAGRRLGSGTSKPSLDGYLSNYTGNERFAEGKQFHYAH